MPELRSAPLIAAPQGDGKPASLVSVQNAIQTLAEMIHKLEGRIGGVALQDSLTVDGDITGDNASINVLTLSDKIVMNERPLEADASTAPDLSTDGQGVIYFDRTLDKFRVSEDGGAFENLVKASPTSLIGAKARRSTNQSIPDSTNTAVSLDVEVFDNGGIWAAGSPTRFTAPETGLYHFGGFLLWDAGGGGWQQIFIRKNGAGTPLASFRLAATAGAGWEFISADVDMTAGDYLELMVYQDSGASVNILTGATYPAAWMHRAA